MNYFIITNGVQQGPFTLDELRQHNISSETLVWTEGMSQWEPAWQVEELKALFYNNESRVTGATPPPPPHEGNGQVAEFSARQHCCHRDDTVSNASLPPKRRGVLSWVLLVLFGLFLAMVLTNPSKKAHRQVLKENITRALTKAVGGDGHGLFARGFNMFDQLLAGPLVDEVLNEALEYHNYIIFSTTSVQTDKGNVTTSYGMFGKVLAADEEVIAQAINASNKEVERGAVDDDWIDRRSDGNQGNEDWPDVSNADTATTKGKSGRAIVKQVQKLLKDKIKQKTDSITSDDVEKIVDKIFEYAKGL